jgi:hypothetical protein
MSGKVSQNSYFHSFCIGCAQPVNITKQGFFDCGKLECPTQKHTIGLMLTADEIETFERNRLGK